MTEEAEYSRQDTQKDRVEGEDVPPQAVQTNLHGGKEVHSKQMEPHARGRDLAPGEEVGDPRERGEELGLEAPAQTGLKAPGKQNLQRVRFPRRVQQEQVGEAYRYQEDLRPAPDQKSGPPAPGNGCAAQEDEEAAGVHIDCFDHGRGPRESGGPDGTPPLSRPSRDEVPEVDGPKSGCVG